MVIRQRIEKAQTTGTRIAQKNRNHHNHDHKVKTADDVPKSHENKIKKKILKKEKSFENK